MIVGDPEVEDPHDVGMGDAGDDLVFLQESLERVGLLGPVGHLTEDFEHHELAGLFALGQIHRRQRRARQLADETLAADHDVAEAVHALGAGR